MEDIDVAIPDGSFTLNRQEDAEDNNVDIVDVTDGENSSHDKPKKKNTAFGGGITLSGLLNAIVRTTSFPE